MALQPSPLDPDEPARWWPALQPLPPLGRRPRPWPPPGRRTRAAVAGIIVVMAMAAVAVARSFSALTSTSPASASEEQGIVDITSRLAHSRIEVVGTGIALDGSGEVVTNDHVVEGAVAITATDVVTGHSYGATVVGSDTADDVAVLQLRGDPAPGPARIGDSSTVAVGEAVVAVGNAAGRGGTPTAARGTVTGMEQAVTAADGINGTFERLSGLIGTDAPVEAGYSGGPLLDAGGNVIGMDTASAAGFVFHSGPQRGFAIPINKVVQLAKGMEAARAATTR